MNLGKNMSNKLLKVKNSKIVYKDRHIWFLKDILLFPSDREYEYSYIKKPDASIIIAKSQEIFYFIKQYRYPAKKYFIQFPLESKKSNE